MKRRRLDDGVSPRGTNARPPRRLPGRVAVAAVLALSITSAPEARSGPPAPAPLPAPSPSAVAALGELEKEASAYEQAARDHRGVISGIVKHHYEERRRRVLSGLDAELVIEKKGLRDAREEAIRRLESFLATHGGRDAHAESTPDAMFRLAALHEERARDEGSSDNLAAGLQPAIALYTRVIDELPRYREIAAVHYYLGHALNDAGRPHDAQQAWRSLVCHDRYPRAFGGGAAARRLPQDHDRAFWIAWEARRRATPPPARKPAARAAAQQGDEMTFESPYPDDCRPIPQSVAAGAEPRYLAEVWWLIGDYHFNEVDPGAGPFAYNRAEVAYRRSLRFKKPPVYGVAMYKLAWTLYKQQRYEASVRQFVDLLRYADAEEKRTGDPGADFRGEAFTYIAGSLTYGDFAGPAAGEPFLARRDILDGDDGPRVVEQKMHVAIDRVQDGRLVPQKEPWTIEIYKALAQEFRDLGQSHNAIEVDELILKRWPLHRDAPIVQSDAADHYDKLAARERDGTSARADTARRAMEARGKMSAYVGATPWVDANKNDPDALRTAMRLAHGGLRRAAADHTNAGSALREQANGRDDTSKRELLERALGEYRLAAQGWAAAASPDEGPSDGYERRWWLADAHHAIVVIEVALGRVPSAADVEIARRSAIAVRDSNDDDRYLALAAQLVVDVAQQVLNARHDLFRRSRGAEGIEPRDKVRTTGVSPNEKVVADPLPKEVADAITARDEYIQRVPAARDVTRHGDLFAFQSGDFEFLYGRFDEARRRLRPIYEQQCKKTPHGFLAWRRLVSMASLERDVAESRRLGEAAIAKGCATTPGDAAIEVRIAKGTISASDYEAASSVFEQAQAMKDGPDRIAKWREAAALYGAALEREPASDAAPEAALNGAHAYKQVGEHQRAIDLYTLFIKEYGSERELVKLEKGDTGKDPPRPADPAKYGKRVGFLKRAWDALAAAHVLLFDHRRAAEAYGAVARNPRFPVPSRRDAARNAALLHASLGDRDKLAASRADLLALSPTAEQKAEIDWLVAAADLKAWDEGAPDTGDNRAERRKAIAAMDAYHAANKSNAAAAGYVVRAAFEAARLRRAGQDPAAAGACRSAVAAFEKLRAGGKDRALGSPEADMAAECAYRLLDEKIKAEFDLATGHHRYEGVIDKVKRAYESDLARAERYYDELQAVITGYESRTWSAAARARQGSLYDGCRTGLFFAQPPRLRLFSDAEERLFKEAARSNDPRLQELVDARQQARREQWRATRERLLADADRPMVKLYAEAVIWGRAWKVKHPAVESAAQRLAALGPLLGDARVRAWTQGIIDPATSKPFDYKDGFFTSTRPGMTISPPPEGLPAPRPATP